jgi:hypothetical protein
MSRPVAFIFLCCLSCACTTHTPQRPEPETLPGSQLTDTRIGLNCTAGKSDVFIRPSTFEFVLYSSRDPFDRPVGDPSQITGPTSLLPRSVPEIGQLIPLETSQRIRQTWLDLCKGLSPMTESDWKVIDETRMPVDLANHWEMRCTGYP